MTLSLAPLLLLLLLLCALSSSSSSSTSDFAPVPTFPLQFSANIVITAHLIEEDSEYPPRERKMKVFYDYINKYARADLEAGYEAAKIYIRRYDEKKEYMVRLPPIDDCKRAYLGELMPYPDIPGSTYVSHEVINGIDCLYFLHEEHDIRVHIYLSADTHAPVRLLQESFENDVSTPLLTYDYSDVKLTAPDRSLFEVPQPFNQKGSCSKHAGGFPYLHIFHYFVKF